MAASYVIIKQAVTTRWFAPTFGIMVNIGIPGEPAPFNSFGGAEEDRTPDLRIANATLSQLSYGPTRSRECTPGRPEKSTTVGPLGKTAPAKVSLNP